MPTRPIDVELEGGPTGVGSISPNLLSVNSVHSELSLSILNSSNRSVCSTSIDQNSVYREASCVPRESVVKRFELQPSIFNNGKFQNPWPHYKPPTITSILRLGFSPDKSKVPSKAELNTILPLMAPCISEPASDDSIRVTWLGHSTVLAEFDNISVLTDPIFSERASPSQVIGPKRYRDPPCSVRISSSCFIYLKSCLDTRFAIKSKCCGHITFTL